MHLWHWLVITMDMDLYSCKLSVGCYWILCNNLKGGSNGMLEEYVCRFDEDDAFGDSS